MSQTHHGKGHPAFTESEAVSFVKEEGVVTTAELAEQFDVSDVAIRKRIKDKFDGIESRKVRNRRVYYVPHQAPAATPDGGGLVDAIPIGGLATLMKPLAGLFGALTLVLAGGNIAYGWPAGYAFFSLIAAGTFYFAYSDFQEVSNPSYGLKDLRNTLEEAKKGDDA